jgi:hypothetical protein
MQNQFASLAISAPDFAAELCALPSYKKLAHTALALKHKAQLGTKRNPTPAEKEAFQKEHQELQKALEEGAKKRRPQEL